MPIRIHGDANSCDPIRGKVGPTSAPSILTREGQRLMTGRSDVSGRPQCSGTKCQLGRYAPPGDLPCVPAGPLRHSRCAGGGPSLLRYDGHCKPILDCALAVFPADRPGFTNARTLHFKQKESVVIGAHVAIVIDARPARLPPDKVRRAVIFSVLRVRYFAVFLKVMTGLPVCAKPSVSMTPCQKTPNETVQSRTRLCLPNTRTGIRFGTIDLKRDRQGGRTGGHAEVYQVGSVTSSWVHGGTMHGDQPSAPEAGGQDNAAIPICRVPYHPAPRPPWRSKPCVQRFGR